MNLDQALRTALGDEAELHTPPRPDLDSLLRGGQSRRRRRTLKRVGATAAVVVLGAGAAFGVAQVDPGGPRTEPDIAGEPSPDPAPSTPPSFQHLNGDVLEGGTYRMLVGFEADGAPIEADLTLDDTGWLAGSQPTVWETGVPSWAGVGVYQPDLLAGGSGCYGDFTEQSRTAATTRAALARQLARLPRSTVVQPPTATVAFGQGAHHLRLRIDISCPDDDIYVVTEPTTGWGRGISYGDPSRQVVIDFWVLDVGGTAVVVDRWHEAGATDALVERTMEAAASIDLDPYD